MKFSESINRSILDFFRKRTVLLSVFLILVLNLLVDIVYAWLDPKVRYR